MLSGVPNGTYLARASFQNDSRVMDPDWIIKFGEPFVTVNNDTVSRPFSITDAVSLVSPTNDSTTAEPLVISTTTPTFAWLKYPSSDEYVVEVINSNGVAIWGGFNNDFTVRNVVLPAAQDTNTVVFNFDGSASEALQSGGTYRWKIYASKDSQEPLGWRLISVSEDQRGLIRVE